MAVAARWTDMPKEIGPRNFRGVNNSCAAVFGRASVSGAQPPVRGSASMWRSGLCWGDGEVEGDGFELGHASCGCGDVLRLGSGTYRRRSQ